MTYFEEGGLEFYVQKDKGRYEATMAAVKWLSDNSLLWTTVGRGASPRKSILNTPDYKTAGAPWAVRGAFVDGMAFATEGEIPVQAGPDFTIYSGRQLPRQGARESLGRKDEARGGDGTHRRAMAEGPRRRLRWHRGDPPRPALP